MPGRNRIRLRGDDAGVEEDVRPGNPALGWKKRALCVGQPLADTFDPPLRVLIETAYDRTTGPGQPEAFNIFCFPNPINTAEAFLIAIPVGLDNGISDFIAMRPLGTTRCRRASTRTGVGGPPVDTGVVCHSPPCAAPAPNPD